LLQGMSLLLCFDDRDTILNDKFKKNWRAFWHAANQLQFLPGFAMATRNNVADGSLEGVWHSWQTQPKVSAVTDEAQNTAAWQAVFELSILPQEQLHALMALGVSEPEVGEDLLSADGAVLGSAELCWSAQKVA